MEIGKVQLSAPMQQVLHLVADGVLLVDARGSIHLINPAAERVTGWRQEEVAGQPAELVVRLVDGVSREPLPCPMDRVLRSGLAVGEVSGRDLLNRRGQSVPVSYQVFPLSALEGGSGGLVVILRDRAIQRQLEQRQQQIQALEAVAFLAGGVAHDFNNLLMGIQGSLALAQMEKGLPEAARLHLQTATRAVTRAGKLGRQLLSFSRGNAPVLETVSPRRMVEEICSFSLRGSAVALELKFEDEPWPCLMDESSISRVLNNLLINAGQAMDGPGMVRVRSANRRLAAGDGLPLRPGCYVCIEVEDNGPGIAPEHLAQVFDPFFTTKKDGTGLGLANCKAILQEHRGHITMESELGRGTRFCIFLPAQAAVQAVEESGGAEAAPSMDLGTGKVLLMDDEDLVREITGDLLRHLGYEPVLAADGGEALKALAREDGNFSAIILDLTVPGKMGGLETRKHLEKLVPEVPVVVSSGYANDPVVIRFEEFGFQAAITKPYTLRELGEVLGRLPSRIRK